MHIAVTYYLDIYGTRILNYHFISCGWQVLVRFLNGGGGENHSQLSWLAKEEYKILISEDARRLCGRGYAENKD